MVTRPAMSYAAPQSLETLAHTPGWTSRVVAYRKRAKDNGTDSLTEKVCSRIKSTLEKPQACTTTVADGHPEPAQRVGSKTG